MLNRALFTFESLVASKDCDVLLSSVAFGMLPALDLPELCAGLTPRPIWFVNTIDPEATSVPLTELRKAYEPAIQAYSKAGSEEHLSFRVEPELTDDMVLDWAQKTLL